VDVLQLLSLQYAAMKTPTSSRVDRWTRDLSDVHWRSRPHGVNSIAWLVWHMARTEDLVVNRFVMDSRQVLDEQRWPARLGVARRDIGTGMTEAEVDDLSRRVDISAVRGYWTAVAERTVGVLGHLRPREVDEIPAQERVHGACAGEGGLTPEAAGVEEAVFTGRSRGWLLADYAVLHNYEHWSDISIVRGLLGLPAV
jgi:hypothetical protein